MSIELGRKTLEKIRGHRLDKFAKCLRLYKETGSVEAAVDQVISDDKEAIEGSSKSYRVDVLGDGKSSLFWEGLRNLYIDFLTLPDSYQVKVIEGEKDDVCELCYLGNHCDSVEVQVGDAIFIDTIPDQNIRASIKRDRPIKLGELKQLIPGLEITVEYC